LILLDIFHYISDGLEPPPNVDSIWNFVRSQGSRPLSRDFLHHGGKVRRLQRVSLLRGAFKLHIDFGAQRPEDDSLERQL